MPRFPGHAPSVTTIRGSVFSSLAHRLEGFAGETCPVHGRACFTRGEPARVERGIEVLARVLGR